MLIVDSCLAVFSPKIRKTNYSFARNTHTHTYTSLPSAQVCQAYLMILNTRIHTYSCMCVCHGLVCLCLGKLKHYVSHTHTHIIHGERETHWYTRLCTHTAARSQLNTTLSLFLSLVYTHAHFPLLENRTFPASGRPNGKNVWTNLRRTRTHVHIQTHNGTFSTHNVDFIFLSRALLSARWPSEAVFPCWTLSGSKTGRFQGLSDVNAGLGSIRNWTIIKMQNQILSFHHSESL